MRRRARLCREPGRSLYAAALSPGDFIGSWIKLLGPAAERAGAIPEPLTSDYVERLAFKSIKQGLANLRSFPMDRRLLEQRRYLLLHAAYFGVLDGRLLALDEDRANFDRSRAARSRGLRASRAFDEAAGGVPADRRPRALARRYDAILCDVWGVLIDGRSHFPGRRRRAGAFSRPGRRVVLVTNASRPTPEVRRQLTGLGLPHAALTISSAPAS